MDLVTQVLIEISRVQTLLFVRKNPYLLVAPTALRELSTRLQTTPDHCWALIEELIEEGFIVPPRKGIRRFLTTLRLSPLGEGLLEWADTRSRLMADPGLGSATALQRVH